jgi:2-polyprenyl-6-hydroxyphenyl methylase/3-demethylubiquinone-9 3-methyltransferase
MPPARTRPAEAASTRDEGEIARFDALAREWWDARGPMAMLHRLNPVRVGFIRDQAVEHFGRESRALRPLEGLSLVDIGCGGGILSEPMARLGAEVTGLDPAPGNVAMARQHAGQGGLAITYREATIETVVEEGARFDIVLAMEVVEHVADVDAFVAACAAALKPGGLLMMATLNRTTKSYALAILGAEYVLRWVPRGTHDWDRFLKPEELTERFVANGLRTLAEAGVVYRPLADVWVLSGDMDVNYMLAAGKPA